MKKLFNVFGLLVLVGLFAACFASCANSSSSSSSSKSLLAKYASSFGGGTDTIYVYDDNTWEEKYSDGIIYTKGTYDILSGDEVNGIINLKVTYSELSAIPVGAVDNITISNGTFRFNGNLYTKIN